MSECNFKLTAACNVVIADKPISINELRSQPCRGEWSAFVVFVVNTNTYKTNLNNAFPFISRTNVNDRDWIIERGSAAGTWIVGVYEQVWRHNTK